MFESRCGVCCESCERKAQVSCTGCLTMQKPFWGGECGVKSCCEQRERDHCGSCDAFPCDRVATMGVAEGFDPAPRLQKLREWAEDKPKN